MAHKTTKANQKEYRFPDHSVAKFVILYYIQYRSFCYTSDIKGGPAPRANTLA